MDFPTLTRRPLLLAAVMALVVSALAVDAASACPSCKQALADSKGGDMIAGYFWSILFMMSMPFTLLGGFSGYMYLLVRRARAAASNTSSEPSTSASGEADVRDRETLDA